MKDQFNTSEKEFIGLCHAFPPDLSLIRQKLFEKINPNSYTEHTTYNGQIIRQYLLSEIFYYFGFDDSDIENIRELGSQYLPEITQIFLEAGFDPAGDDGRAGSDAIASLMYCCPDEYIIPTAKLLLDAGADPRIAPTKNDPHEDALEQIYYDATVWDDESRHHRAKILFQLYEFISDYILKKNFGREIFNFIVACREDFLDFPWIRERLKQGLDVNASFTTRTPDGYPFKQYLIHEILDRFGKYPYSVAYVAGFGCADLPDLLRLLFDYGLDLYLDDGLVGTRALYKLIWCKFDEHVLESARILLDHGANPNISAYEYEKRSFAEYLTYRIDHDIKEYGKLDERFQQLLDVISTSKE